MKMTFKQFCNDCQLFQEARRRKSKAKSKRRGLRRFRNTSPKSVFLPTLMNMPTPRQELTKNVQKPVAKAVPKNLPPPPPVKKPWKKSPTSNRILPRVPQPLRGSPKDVQSFAKNR
jgi:hypothetical protein